MRRLADPVVKRLAFNKYVHVHSSLLNQCNSSNMASRTTVLVCSLLVVFILAQLFAYNKLSVMKSFPSFQTSQLSDEEALLELSLLCSKLNIKLYLLDVKSLEYVHSHSPKRAKDLLQEDQFDKFYSFGMDGKNIHLFQVQIDPLLQIKGFDIVYIKNIQPEQTPKPTFKNKVVAILLKKQDLIFHIYVLHSREGFWWIGSVSSDPYLSGHLNTLGLSLADHINAINSERALEKFQSKPFAPVPGLYIPNNITYFLTEFQSSKFKECPVSKARMFSKEHRYITSQAFRFMHKSYKLLSRVASIMYHSNVEFWLSSGTCLGYYRECNIIPYSSDVDIGLYARDFSPALITKFTENNFTLKHRFGLPNDSLEYSFVASSIPDVKLDVFFFYEEGDSVWNGATQPESRRKYKFTFPKFDLCWTEFISLKVRVPCETQLYLESIYGPNWGLSMVLIGVVLPFPVCAFIRENHLGTKLGHFIFIFFSFFKIVFMYKGSNISCLRY
uniref:Fukutin n=1 Tax=Cacopsylla melanoneura TaxID=428564 RepID=A0A8D9EVY4_9HEMI